MRKRANAGTVDAARLEEMAEHRLLSLDELAARLGMAPRTLRALRSGEVGLTEERRARLLLVFGAQRLAYLLGESDVRPRRPLLVLGKSRLGGTRTGPVAPPRRRPPLFVVGHPFPRSTPRPRVDGAPPRGPKAPEK